MEFEVGDHALGDVWNEIDRACRLRQMLSCRPCGATYEIEAGLCWLRTLRNDSEHYFDEEVGWVAQLTFVAVRRECIET